MLLLISVTLTVGVSLGAPAQVQSCDFPEIKYGSLYNEKIYKPDFPVAVGNWYYYSCNDSFVTHSESYWHYVTCTGEGWSPPVPCRRKCIFKSVENGFSPYRERIYYQGDSAKVECHPGYSLPNQQISMTCTENDWFPPPTCIPVKEACCHPPRFDNAILMSWKKRSYRCFLCESSHSGKCSSSRRDA
ncbi:complement factor H-related protein 3-like [Rhinolophus ferrumequinum]|uniref:complement factor H-related protein 3-like n=1 Tax=Rhinolophus ferrumequinum TaxID=59479 RepID=UPI00140F66D0|nr:complement factor H-related protein 3-like [Rhinolophus ferrumequinum]